MKDLSGSARPTHADYTAEKMETQFIKDIIMNDHTCAFGGYENSDRYGDYIPCNYNLWGKTFAASVVKLTNQRK
eukprot:2578309-Pleurochrysis_carterae.AAC.1